MWNMNEVLHARYLRDYVVHLEFDDGLQGEVDLSSYLARGPVFMPLADHSFFAKFSIEGGSLAWPNGADIAPERLYELTQSANKEGAAGRRRGGPEPTPETVARRGCALTDRHQRSCP